MLLTCFDPGLLSDGDTQLMYSLMPKSRQDKFDRYRFEKDRRLCALSYTLLLYTIYEAGGELCSRVEFSFGANGKPSLAGRPSLFFNLSHCDAAAVCALSCEEVGVDVQDIVHADEGLVNAVLCEAERRLVMQSGDPDKAFTRLWACRESYLKRVGTGLDDSLRKLDFSQYNEPRFDAYGCRFYTSTRLGCAISCCGTAAEPYQEHIVSKHRLENFLSRYQ